MDHADVCFGRTGEITRGMLVVDRRDDQGAYAPGANRAQVQAELQKHPGFHPHGILESTAVPAQVEVDDATQAHPVLVAPHSEAQEASWTELEGVIVAVGTPGPVALLELVTKRVWGVGR